VEPPARGAKALDFHRVLATGPWGEYTRGGFKVFVSANAVLAVASKQNMKVMRAFITPPPATLVYAGDASKELTHCADYGAVSSSVEPA
jgi:hypothetical protein